MPRPWASKGAGKALAHILKCVALAALVAAALVAGPVQAANLRQYAVVVMDGKTGRVIHSRAADATRYPASITKVMTLYLLFQEMEAGRMSLSTRMRVSAHAAAAQPTKLNVSAGSTIKVEDAILALVTKSANDVARVIAEAISGTESKFAERMTDTAHALGMSRTTYRNASGLPDSGQVTTVRDQARLAMAIYQHFPQYYHYFQTRSFRYAGQTYGNHDRLLGYNGIDGIKTGYIRASGFNLLTSATKNDRHLVVAAFGFDSAAARDARVRELVNKYLPDAHAGATWQQALVPRPDGGYGRYASPIQVALDGTPPPRPAYLRTPTEPDPIALPELPVRSDIVLASFDTQAPAPPDRPATGAATQPLDEPLALLPVELGTPERDQFTPANVLGNFIAEVFGTGAGPAPVASPAAAGPAPATTLVPPADVGAPLTTGSAGAAQPLPSGGWTVQVGAAPSEAGAHLLLTQAGTNLAELSDYRSLIQPVERDGQELYRARFVGFADRSEASAMCEALKRRSINCLAMPG